MEPLTAWLEESLSECVLPSEARDYLMGRGATSEVLASWGMVTWRCPSERCPDPTMARVYGPHFEKFVGKVLYPLRSARGALLGFDSRTVDEKDEKRVMLPEAAWCPTWIGMPQAMGAIWEARDITIVEGRYDVFAVQHATPDVMGSGPAHLAWKHIEFLRRWLAGKGAHVYMAFDRDAAGKRGTLQALQNLKNAGVSCSELRYGKLGDDPGQIWDRRGREGVRSEFKQLLK